MGANLYPKLLQSLTAAGCRLVRQGKGSHEIWLDRKSTRLNSSHLVISYAVFCLKKTVRGETAVFAVVQEITQCKQQNQLLAQTVQLQSEEMQRANAEVQGANDRFQTLVERIPGP